MAKPGRKPKPHPPIQVMARMTGFLQWICPHCAYIHGSVRVKWRQAFIFCFACDRRYRVGIGFASQAGGTIPPFNAIFAGVFNNYNTNALENMPPSVPAIGRVVGRVDWVCPDCQTPQSTKTDWDLCSTECLRCQKRWYLRLILWRSAKIHPIATPRDWTPLVRQFGNRKTHKYEDITIPVICVDAETGSTSTGENS